jgi:chromosome segregation ATPase
LEAARNLEERVLPLSTLLEIERADNAAHQKQIASLEAKLKQTESLNAEVARLRVRLDEAEKDCGTAASLAEKANKRAVARQEDNKGLKESLERYRRAVKNKDEEIERMKTELEMKKTKVWLRFCHSCTHIDLA